MKFNYQIIRSEFQNVSTSKFFSNERLFFVGFAVFDICSQVGGCLFNEHLLPDAHCCFWFVSHGF